MDGRPAHLIYEFGDFRLDALRRVLSLRGDREPLQVSGRVFDALLHFVERPGQLLEKAGLMDAIWPNVVVEEANLTQTIHTLRRLLGERPDEHRYIVTVPGRGYRFVAEVTRVPDGAAAQAAPGAQRTRRVLGVASAAIVVVGLVAFLALRSGAWPPPAAAEPPSIAVLPFVDMSPEQNQEYFGDGLSEEILNALAQSPSLRVIARTSSFSFKNRSVDIATIADELDVTHVLEGSVRKSGERVRVTAQLVDAKNSAHVWSHTYDRDLKEVLSVQADIAAAVAEALEITLEGAGVSGARAAHSASPQAFERYLQGRHYFARRGPGDLDRAKHYFEDAVRIDPGYGRAWSGLAGFYFVSADVAPRSEEATRKWREAVEKAMARLPNDAEAHMRAAQYDWENGNAAAADAHLQRATALNPFHPLVLGAASTEAVLQGDLRKATALVRRSLTVDPLSAVTRMNLGIHLMAIGERREAQAQFEAALELGSRPEIHGDIARILVLDRQPDAALARMERVPQGPWRDHCLALIHHVRARPAESEAALARLIDSASSDRSAAVRLMIAEVYAFRGQADEAFRWLASGEHAARNSRAMIAGGSWMTAEMHLSPFLASLHADPRWRSLLLVAARQS